MPRPKFTHEEEVLINYMKLHKLGDWNPYLWGYLTGGVILGAFGFYHESVPMMSAAFVVIIGFRLYEEWYQRKMQPLWTSVLQKYEAAVSE